MDHGAPLLESLRPSDEMGLIGFQPLVESVRFPLLCTRASSVNPIEVSCNPSTSDFSFLSFSSIVSVSSAGSSSTSPSVYQLAQESTDHLVLLCEASDYHPDLEALTTCVLNGADVLCHPPGQMLPLLHWFVRTHQVAVVQACLEYTPRVLLSLTAMEGTAWCCTPAHCLCAKVIADEDSREMLLAFLARQARYPQEVGIDWGMLNGQGRTFLQLAADHQKLSLLWPLVSSQLFFVRRILRHTPLYLSRAVVWRWEWEALQEWQEFFSLENAFVVEADRPTGLLCKYRWLGEYDVQAVRACVAGGAVVDFSFQAAGNLFYEYLRKAPAECVAALLRTARPISLRFSDPDAATGGLCSLFAPAHSAADVAVRLRLLVERLTSRTAARWDHPDTIRWGLEGGTPFLTQAARCGMLSTVWPIIKDIPPFSTATASRRPAPHCSRHKQQPEGTAPVYALKVKLSPADWHAMPEPERGLFSFSGLAVLDRENERESTQQVNKQLGEGKA